MFSRMRQGASPDAGLLAGYRGKQPQQKWPLSSFASHHAKCGRVAAMSGIIHAPFGAMQKLAAVF
jgi:hypothetical protein